MGNVLLTGSSGWLGRHLAPMLVARGDQVVGLDVAPGAYTSLVGNVGDEAFVQGVFAQHAFDAIVHAAALHKPDIARFAPQSFVTTNVQGTLNLLEAARRHAIERFVFTSTTSLMIDKATRAAQQEAAVWLDENPRPLSPRNIYGVTKYAAENLCRQYSEEHGLNTTALRVSRFFPEIDDTILDVPSENLKANEFLNRRHTVADSARAHLHALDHMRLGYSIYLISSPTPFARADCSLLKTDAAAVVATYFPEAQELYARKGWRLPRSIARVYDGTKICSELGFEYQTDFGAILDALRGDQPMPFVDDPSYVNPSTVAADLIREP